MWFVDIVRLLASFQMINGHTLDAIMPLHVKQGPIFERYDDMRSLVSVAFLLIAGIAFHLSTLARLDRHLSTPGAGSRRLQRAAIIIGFGYYLHASAAVGILQCIGAALIFLEILTLTLRDARKVMWACSALAAALFAAAPVIDGAALTLGTPWIGQWFTHHGLEGNEGSLFPLVPWAGYVFAGVAVGGLILPDGGRTDRDLTIRRAVLLFAGAWAAMTVAELVPFTLATDATSVHARPTVALAKLAAVAALLAILAVVCRRLVNLPWLLRVLASETLTIYVFHLMFLYFPGVDLVARVGRTETLGAALLWVIPVFIATCAYAVAWHEVKRRWHRRWVERRLRRAA